MYEILYQLPNKETYVIGQGGRAMSFRNDLEARRFAEQHYQSNLGAEVYALQKEGKQVLIGYPGRHWADRQGQTKAGAELYGGTFIEWGR